MKARSPSLARLALVTFAAAGLLAAGPAAAQDPIGEPTLPPAVDPALGTAPELTPILLAPGRTEIRVPLVIGLSSGSAGKPINVPLDVYYGVTESLTLGLTHSGGVVQPTAPYPPSQGLCFTGDGEGQCPKVYNNVGLDALYGILGGTLQLAAHGGLEVRSIADPFQVALRLGVLFQAPLAERVALVTDPRVWIGLNERDVNQDRLDLPFAIQYWVTDPLRLAVRTVFGGPLDNFDAAYTGSLGLFGGFSITPAVEGFASFDFLNLYGKGGDADARALVVGANFRL